jgi:hypothetical protein
MKVHKLKIFFKTLNAFFRSKISPLPINGETHLSQENYLFGDLMMLTLVKIEFDDDDASTFDAD